MLQSLASKHNIMSLKIEFGSGGPSARDGYLSCDVRDLDGVDYVCEAIDIVNHVNENSVDEIYSRHFFEHLTFYDGVRLVSSWIKILKKGGIMEMILPDIDYHARQWIEHGGDNSHARAGFWGWQRRVETGAIWDIHKSGYNFKTLNKLLWNAGFNNIKRIGNGSSVHLHIKCNKP